MTLFENGVPHFINISSHGQQKHICMVLNEFMVKVISPWPSRMKTNKWPGLSGHVSHYMVIFQFAMLVYQRVNLHFPMGFPMVFLFSHGFSYGFPMVFLFSHGFSYGFPMVFLFSHWYSYGFPMVSHYMVKITAITALSAPLQNCLQQPGSNCAKSVHPGVPHVPSRSWDLIAPSDAI